MQAFKDPWRKGKIAMDSIFRMDVDDTARALGALGWRGGSVAAKSVTPLITRGEPCCLPRCYQGIMSINVVIQCCKQLNKVPTELT